VRGGVKLTHNVFMMARSILGWGTVIYAVVYLVWAIIVVHGLSESIFARCAMLLTLLAVLAIATTSLRTLSKNDIYPLSFGWASVALFFDALLIAPISGFAIFAQWNVWVGYLLMLFIPHLVIRVRARRSHDGSL
jgi:hypothetical protein